MAPDNDPVGILQQIALNNQLIPNMHSPPNKYQKENNDIMNHPFYRNMAQMNNARSNYDKSLLENRFHNQNQYNKDQKSPPTKQSNFQSKKDSIPIEKGFISKQYQNNENKKDEHSFQSLSSVSVNNEVSAATDMQIEDFFDPKSKIQNSKYAKSSSKNSSKLKQSNSQAYLSNK